VEVQPRLPNLRNTWSKSSPFADLVEGGGCLIRLAGKADLVLFTPELHTGLSPEPVSISSSNPVPAAADWCMAGKCLDDLNMTSLSPNPAPDPSEEACSAEGNCDIDRVARPFIRSSKRKNSIQMHFNFQYKSQYFQHPSPSSESTPKLCIHSHYIRRILRYYKF